MGRDNAEGADTTLSFCDLRRWRLVRLPVPLPLARTSCCCARRGGWAFALTTKAEDAWARGARRRGVCMTT